MSREAESESGGPVRAVSRRLADVDLFPVAFQAVLKFYARSGTFDRDAIRIRNLAEDTLEGFLEDCYRAIEREIEKEMGFEEVSFTYDTKLTLPVELTIGYLYRRAIQNSPDSFNPVTGDVRTPIMEYFRIPYDKKHERRREERFRAASEDELQLVRDTKAISRLCTEALLDGDMQDAINDDEFEDFVLNRDLNPQQREAVAGIAQHTLHERVTDLFEEFSPQVQEQYDWAVDASERHQNQDAHFRDLFTGAREGEEEAIEAIEAEYKHASFDDPPEMLTEAEQSLPYCKTQYERVGVIYDGMIEMYRASGISIDDSFKRAVVLAIIGAQIWLDDIDDYPQDTNQGQLTPVTAEYMLHDSERDAYDAIVSITEEYLERASSYAIESDSLMTGIAIEYIHRSGNPAVLPTGRP
ncbi:hypothetical protein [Halorubellus salinus]|uniref:hypothetical protein n=1 Tax=Halorubellus salinus TaxID=755309 RepID=UPI001D064574|nr:hypothetical protein [Halorubellus salinus]